MGEKKGEWENDEKFWDDKLAKIRVRSQQLEQQLELEHKEIQTVWETMMGEKREQWSKEGKDWDDKLAKLKANSLQIEAHSQQVESHSQQLQLKY
jgi:G:T-mismatch repair DNA endonuclease (very short patch repair protein)